MREIVNVRVLAMGGLAIALAACSARVDRTNQSATHSTAEEGSTQQIRMSKVPPGHCRIIATLLGVDSTLEAAGPCSQAPCRATVRVDSVLAYGAAFSNPLAVHARINVRFAFTVGPTTKELFPTMTDRLPGIRIGNRFQTDLESREEMQSEGHTPLYLIYTYTLLP